MYLTFIIKGFQGKIYIHFKYIMTVGLLNILKRHDMVNWYGIYHYPYSNQNFSSTDCRWKIKNSFEQTSYNIFRPIDSSRGIGRGYFDIVKLMMWVMVNNVRFHSKISSYCLDITAVIFGKTAMLIIRISGYNWCIDHLGTFRKNWLCVLV